MRLIIIMVIAIILAVVLPIFALGYNNPFHTDKLIIQEFRDFGGDTSNFNEEEK